MLEEKERLLKSKINLREKRFSKKDFHKWKRKLSFADKSLYILVIILLGLFRPDTLMISVYFAIYLYLYLTKRKQAFYHLYVSSIIALAWIIIANHNYKYNIQMLYVFGLNSYPLFAWAIGLFAAYIIYSHWENKISSESYIKKLIMFTIIYWFMLILVETIAYHVFDIRNLYTAIYSGLPICNCIHAPVWMQIIYFLLGPIYFTICELIGLENPHKFNRN